MQETEEMQKFKRMCLHAASGAFHMEVNRTGCYPY